MAVLVKMPAVLAKHNVAINLISFANFELMPTTLEFYVEALPAFDFLHGFLRLHLSLPTGNPAAILSLRLAITNHTSSTISATPSTTAPITKIICSPSFSS
jgi:hypothetical protein